MLRKKSKKCRYMMHGLGEVNQIYCTNSYDSLQKWTNLGMTSFEADVSITEDNQFVLAHLLSRDMLRKAEVEINGPITHEAYSKTKLYQKSSEGLSTLTLQNLIDYLKNNPHLTIMLDLYQLSIKRESFSLFMTTIVNLVPKELQSQIILELFDDDMVQESRLLKHNFQIIYFISYNDITSLNKQNDIISKIQSYDIKVVSIPWQYTFKNNILTRLKKSNITIVSFSNYMNIGSWYLKRNGVRLIGIDQYLTFTEKIKNVKSVIKVYRNILKHIICKYKILYILANGLRKKISTNKLSKRNKKALALVKNKVKSKKINVFFLVADPTIFRLEELYNTFLDSDVFIPYIGIFPYTHAQFKARDERYNECKKFFEDKSYQVIELYNLEKNILELEKYNPDIVVFCNTFALLWTDELIKQSINSVRIYIPYGCFLTNLQQSQFNSIYHNSMNYQFLESKISIDLSKKYSDNKGKNSYFLGYPKIDLLISQDKKFIDVWKTQEHRKKRVIWAPHHSIENDQIHYGFSCFLYIADFMLDLAEQYKDQIQIAFKPHPLLKDRLYETLDWGIERTNRYFDKWSLLENTQFEDGDYDNLFLSSDAMILDSISFIAEYAVTGKPLLFTVRDNTIKDKFNEYGQLLFDEVVYKAYNLKDDIVKFIECIVINNQDKLKEKRLSIVKKYMLPDNQVSAQQNIYDFILQEIKNDKSTDSRSI